MKLIGIAGVGFSDEKTKQALKVFENEFERGPIQLKTTDKPLHKNALYYRYDYGHSHVMAVMVMTSNQGRADDLMMVAKVSVMMVVSDDC